VVCGKRQRQRHTHRDIERRRVGKEMNVHHFQQPKTDELRSVLDMLSGDNGSGGRGSLLTEVGVGNGVRPKARRVAGNESGEVMGSHALPADEVIFKQVPDQTSEHGKNATTCAGINIRN
jgi:hypothetical protein